MFFFIYSRFLHTLFFSYNNSLVIIDLIDSLSKIVVKKVSVQRGSTTKKGCEALLYRANCLVARYTNITPVNLYLLGSNFINEFCNPEKKT